ncbi:methyl-accepting chemotaxis protein [Lichenicola sp.]|uniref:methyl-accepting chemotaxis protein n=1 Tax=Lichenicola sp. TaxID=2804529 RepID=UPI003B001DEB
MQRVAAIAAAIDVGGVPMPMSDATRIVDVALREGIDALLAVSQQAGRMVTALDQVISDVVATEQCVGQIEAISRQTRFVALNARIEANRADASGGTFKVIANELKDLSEKTDATSHLVRSRVGDVVKGVRHAHAQLEEIAAVDTSRYRQTQQQLDAVLSGMVVQNRNLAAVVDETIRASSGIAETIAQIVMGAQFQDRATQHLNHVMEAIEVLAGATATLQSETERSLPQLPRSQIDRALLERILERQTLSLVQERFLGRLLGTPVPEPARTSFVGDVELF